MTKLQLRYGRLDDRGRRRFDLECAERALPYFEALHPGDDRPRRALAVGRAYLEGLATLEELEAAARLARAAHEETADEERSIAPRAARAAERALQTYNPALASSDYFPSAASELDNVIYMDVTRGDVDRADLGDAARLAELDRQLARIDELLSDD